MPIRMLRDWTNSDKMRVLSVHAERFFTRLIMKADDYGCFYADSTRLKANLFPLLLDTVREADISRWMAECQKAGLIVIYESEGKRYLQIIDFKQRLDKAKRKFPLPSSNDSAEIVNDFPSETENEEETEIKEAKASSGKKAKEIVLFDQDKELRKAFSELSIPDNAVEAWTLIKEWITTNKPQFIEPYVLSWNVFASFYKLPEVKKITDSRKKKFGVRIKESGFDWIEVLAKVRKSEYLKSGSWFGFDWILENDKNYIKILEGNYQ